MLCGEGIVKSFGKQVVLDNVDLHVEPGKITALIGPSGSGKSTLLRALSLLDPPGKGTVSLNGNTYSFPLANGDRIESPYPDLTVVFQQLFLWPHLTLRENIEMPLRETGKVVDRAKLARLYKLFEMESFCERHPNEVSMGQRQRAAIVRALALDPSYILFDEVTSALDVQQIRAVLDCLARLKEEGIGILVITHLIRFARRAADQVVFLNEGRVLEAGPPSILDAPEHPQLREFLSLVEAAS